MNKWTSEITQNKKYGSVVLFASVKLGISNLGQPINEHSFWPLVKRDYKRNKGFWPTRWYELGTIPTCRNRLTTWLSTLL